MYKVYFSHLILCMNYAYLKYIITEKTKLKTYCYRCTDSNVKLFSSTQGFEALVLKPNGCHHRD